MRRSSIIPSDPNKAAALTAKPETERSEQSFGGGSAVSLYLATIGRKGGLKGGRARANSLSADKRSEIARRAAEARWSVGKGK